MNHLHFADNIVRLRRIKKITQEQLADFVGVTKASVSKWETGQSLPDVLLLPRIAAYFDVTIDELLGYELWLSKEQIRKLYQELASDFAERPFEEVMEKSRGLVKRYYSCYPFLFQMASLWLNHAELEKDAGKQRQVLEEIRKLCEHIIEDCKDIGICNDAMLLRSLVELQLGKTQEVIETLEELLNPYRLVNQSDGLLIQAYQMSGNMEKAGSFTQISMFLHLMSLVGSAVQYLNIHSGDLKVCKETITRIRVVAEAYELEQLHPNTMAQFYYQAAIVYCMHGQCEEAVQMLERYGAVIEELLKDGQILLHGDAYFDRLSEWIEKLDIGADAPRDMRVVMESVMQTLEHPAFKILEEDAAFVRIKRRLAERGGNL